MKEDGANLRRAANNDGQVGEEEWNGTKWEMEAWRRSHQDGRKKGERSVCEIASRVRKEIVCQSCSRARSASYRFLFPLRLVLGVFVLLQKSLGEGRECQCIQKGSEVFGGGFPRELVLSTCTYSVIKTKKILQMKFVCFQSVNLYGGTRLIFQVLLK